MMDHTGHLSDKVRERLTQLEPNADEKRRRVLEVADRDQRQRLNPVEFEENSRRQQSGL